MSKLNRWMVAAAAAALLAPALLAQQGGHDHAQHAGSTAAGPTESGQAAFAAIAEVVRLLHADTTTDWSKVDLERLRQHLIDMDDVTLRAQVSQTPVPGGVRMDVRGSGRTRDAIRRMSRMHAEAMASDRSMRATVADAPEGAVVTVVGATPGDGRTEQRIRALGFIGWLTLTEHHAPHHLGLAKGTMSGHGHQ